MRDLYLWMRVGDQDDYAQFNSIDEATEHLHSCLDMDEDCVGHDVDRYVGGALVGITVDHYFNNNAVSFFWGDKDAELETPITEWELQVVQNILG